MTPYLVGLGLFFLITYLFWICFLAYAGIKAAKDDGRAIPRTAMVLASPFVFAAFVFDIVYNIFLGSILFVELPKTATLTARASSHLRDGLRMKADRTWTERDPDASLLVRWRGALARWLCANLLDPFQLGGHCSAIALLAVVLVFALSPAPAFAQSDTPDPGLTPGVAVRGLTVKRICATKWGKDARHVKIGRAHV